MASSPMMHTRETYRIAGTLVDEYGAHHAPLIAATRCETLLVGGGDLNDLVVWRGVLLAVREIVRTDRDVGEQMN